jgi:hypothetical protein
VARTTLLELAAGEIGGGPTGGGGPGGGPSGEPKSVRRCIRTLDELTEAHRVVAIGRWFDRQKPREIRGALLERCSVKASPEEVRILVAEVRADLDEGPAGEGPPRAIREGCGAFREEFAALLEGESILKRRRARLEAHISSCAVCSRALESGRESDRRLAGALSRGVRAHPRLASLEEYRTGISSSATRRHFLERHLGGCAACRSLLAALDALEGLDPDRLLARASMRRLVRKWLPWSALALALLTLAGAWAAWEAGEKSRMAGRFRGLGVLDVRVDYARGMWPFDGLPREEDPLWRRGSHAYREGRCREAAAEFLRYSTAVPEDAAGRLMQGAALLCAGDPGAASSVLEPLASGDQDALVGEAEWLLVHSRLALGEIEGVESVLDGIAEGGGRHAEEAEALLERIR